VAWQWEVDKVLEIFCPKCSELILDQETCPSCGWHRPAPQGVGALVWCADLGTRLIKPYCYPTMAEGNYLVATEDGAILALDSETGQVQWEHQLAQGTVAHTLVSDGERLFVEVEDVNTLPTDGKPFLALDVKNGAERWRYATEARCLSAPCVDGAHLFFSGSDGQLFALDAASGRLRWVVPHPIWGPYPPVEEKGVVCVGGRGPALVGYSAKDGRELWRCAGGGWFANKPCSGEGQVHALCWDDQLYTVEAQSGKVLWQVRGERGKGFTSPPLLANGHLYLASRVLPPPDDPEASYAMLSLRASDGIEEWRFYLHDRVEVPAAIADDNLFFGTYGAEGGVFYALDAGNGRERWRTETKSRAVTQPCVSGDVVFYGGRDGLIHALRWRAAEREKPLAPGTYRKRGDLVNAAAAHALRGEFEQAAQLYEQQLGQAAAAARLYEKGGVYGKAAAVWEAQRDWRRARELYSRADDKRGQARALEALNELLPAARMLEELGELSEAARLYLAGEDRTRAAELYERLGQVDTAQSIWQAIGAWEKQVELQVREGQLAAAASVLEAHGRADRASELYEQAGELPRALMLATRLQQWERVASLAQRIEAFELEGQAWARLEEHKRAGEAFERAAQAKAAASPSDEERIAALLELAAEQYAEVYEEDKINACRAQVRRYRHLPEVVIHLEAGAAFVEHQWNQLTVSAENRGHGVARDIHVLFQGCFDVDGENAVRGLAAGRVKALPLLLRPQKDQYGPKVPLQVVVSYEDMHGKRYEHTFRFGVQVVQGGLIPGVTTPLEFHLHGDVLQPGASKVEERGDRVEIHREGGQPRIIASAAGCGTVMAVRPGAADVRRCPGCNLPIADTKAVHCPECGARLAPLTSLPQPPTEG